MKKYKQITIGKIADHGGTEKTPTHAITTYGDDKQKITVGKLWTKTSDYGKFLSGLLSDDYTSKEGKFYEGYCIVSLKDLKALEDEIASLSRNELTSAGTKVPDFSEVDQDIPF